MQEGMPENRTLTLRKIEANKREKEEENPPEMLGPGNALDWEEGTHSETRFSKRKILILLNGKSCQYHDTFRKVNVT